MMEDSGATNVENDDDEVGDRAGGLQEGDGGGSERHGAGENQAAGQQARRHCSPASRVSQIIRIYLLAFNGQSHEILRFGMFGLNEGKLL